MATSLPRLPFSSITRSSSDFSSFNTSGKPCKPHHKTEYFGISSRLMPARKKLYLTPPHRCKERLKPTASRRGLRDDSLMYTYSARPFPVTPIWRERDMESAQTLESAMADVSRYEGKTVLRISCYADDQLDDPTPDQVTVHIRRKTTFKGNSRTVRANYTSSLTEWVAWEPKLNKHQWYQELEDLRTRRTDRAFFNVQMSLNRAHHPDLRYEWFDPDIFGDSNIHRPIVWFKHPDRKQYIRSHISRVPRSDLEDNEYDQRCPICLDPYSDEPGEQSAKIPCVCGKFCGENCLMEWLLQEGTNACPQCGSHISIPTYYSPYAGGLALRLPGMHRREYQFGRIQSRLRNELMTPIHSSISESLELLFFEESLTATMSEDLGETHRFWITGSAPQYDVRKDLDLYTSFHDNLRLAFKDLLESWTVLSELGLFNRILEVVMEKLTADVEEGSTENSEELFEPAFTAYIRETCYRASTLAAGYTRGLYLRV